MATRGSTTAKATLAKPRGDGHNEGMFVVDLECSTGHAFEGWYDTSKEYEVLAENSEVTCPLCGSAEITRHLSTGGFLSTRRSPEERVFAVTLSTH
jgi:hypothetical protein